MRKQTILNKLTINRKPVQGCAKKRRKKGLQNDCLLKYLVTKGSSFKGCRRRVGEPIELKLTRIILHSITVLVLIEHNSWGIKEMLERKIQENKSKIDRSLR